MHAINAALENAGRTVNYVAAADADEQDNIDDIRALARDMSGGSVQALLILGGNPVYDAPADLKFKEALAKVPLSICLSDRADETGAACTWHVPRAHELEALGRSAVAQRSLRGAAAADRAAVRRAQRHRGAGGARR